MCSLNDCEIKRELITFSSKSKRRVKSCKTPKRSFLIVIQNSAVRTVVGNEMRIKGCDTSANGCLRKEFLQGATVHTPQIHEMERGESARHIRAFATHKKSVSIYFSLVFDSIPCLHLTSLTCKEMKLFLLIVLVVGWVCCKKPASMMSGMMSGMQMMRMTRMQPMMMPMQRASMMNMQPMRMASGGAMMGMMMSKKG